MRIGVMAALPEEIGDLAASLAGVWVQRAGPRDFTCGQLHGHALVLAVSLWGKVSAATTATLMLAHHRVDAIVFTGLAGAIGVDTQPGDVVVGDHAIQHDLDPRPLFARYEIGSLRQGLLPLDARLCAASVAAARRFVVSDAAISGLAEAARAGWGRGPGLVRVHCGLIATGDQFFSSTQAVHTLRAALPQALCVEMEGAAVAQVCAEHGVPCALIRTLSDYADEDADAAFSGFMAQAARIYSQGILRELLTSLPK